MLYNSTCQNKFVQDPIHVATKLRNKLLKPGMVLRMGTAKVTVDHLMSLIRCCSKEIHGLNISDVSPNGRQKFSSFEKITSQRVLNILETYVPGSEGTTKYLKLCSAITSSY